MHPTHTIISVAFGFGGRFGERLSLFVAMAVVMVFFAEITLIFGLLPLLLLLFSSEFLPAGADNYHEY